ncbi:MAG: hypothetical protein K6G83_04695 [Lachnospiraceae bacterium]|nr:hypothetical protein [Lachnospiraceae bacterium]
MFTERFNEIMTMTGARNRKIAGLAGMDASSFSRLRSGHRIPPKTSPTIRKISTGIYLYMDDRSRLDDLCVLIGAPKDASAESIKSALIDWLYDGQELPAKTPPKRTRSRRRQTPDCKTFGMRLDSAMQLAELSNIQFSHLVNVDTSLISRFRSGVRTPNSNPVIARRITSVLWERLKSLRKTEELANLMHVPADKPDREAFHQWLCGFDELYTVEAYAAERLSESFDSFSTENNVLLPAPDEVVPAHILNDTRDLYEGYEGLRTAVLCFLGNAAKSRAKELLLYSDQAMDWMVEDPAFRLKWAALMAACIKNGTKIRIIHNIDRSLDQMNEAIISWLPLYMTGMIESYYHPLPAGSRFSYTLFLNPGQACILASHVTGTEQGGRYRYLTTPDFLSESLETFRSLSEQCLPLMQITQPYSVPACSKGLTAILPSLSISTMPRELAEELGGPLLVRERDRRRKTIDRVLKTGIYYECVPLADSETLSASNVTVQALQDAPPLHYTKEQYAAHIRQLITLTEQCPNYRLIPLPDTAFANMELLITGESGQIIHTCPPFICIEFTHPLICRSFTEYAGRLIGQYKMDRRSLVQLLKDQYIIE